MNIPSRRHQPSAHHSLAASESGNALIELAFSLPLFLVLILGTAELANLAWASVQVNNAARAAAAYASQSHATAVPTNPFILTAAQNEAPKLAITFPTPPAQLCSCVGTDGSSATVACDSTALSSCPSPSTIQVAVQVNAQAVVTPFVRYPGLPATYTVNAQATMGVAQ